MKNILGVGKNAGMFRKDVGRKMDNYYLFGCGVFGQRALRMLGAGNVSGFIDNNQERQGKEMEGIVVYSLEEVLEKDGYRIVLSVEPQSQNEMSIRAQLDSMSVQYISIQKAMSEISKRNIGKSMDNIGRYKKSIKWIYDHTVNGKAIICDTGSLKAYPEVTGYYIPTLLRWGHRELAISFAKWLCNVQKEDGSWFDSDDKSAYVFDSGQVLKGLIAIRTILPEVDEHILRGCDWIVSNVQKDGRLTTPSMEAWGDNGECSELIHLYCLSPLRDAAEIFQKKEYEDVVAKVISYYKVNHYNEIINFNLLSHFYAYIMEALLDLGEVAIVKKAMARIAKLQKESGAVPAYNNVDWVCSTGLFQLALVWFRLGEIERGNRAFSYACSLQNESGGWYGSYVSEENIFENNNYFQNSEISWAVKFFLDALSAKNKAEFEACADIFLESISMKSERYRIVSDVIKDKINHMGQCKVLDVGCGKGRYLRNLYDEFDDKVNLYGVDLSENVMEYIKNDSITCAQGSLTCIPYSDSVFDAVYACESLEHAIDIYSAVREMCRVAKPDGTIVIIDKNAAKLGNMQIEEWETWFYEDELKEIMQKYCSDIEVKRNLSYEGGNIEGLFYAWIGNVK